jgi:hypothetical protein
VVIELGDAVGAEAACARVAAGGCTAVVKFVVDAAVVAGVVVGGEHQAQVVPERVGVIDREPARAVEAAHHLILVIRRPRRPAVAGVPRCDWRRPAWPDPVPGAVTHLSAARSRGPYHHGQGLSCGSGGAARRMIVLPAAGCVPGPDQSSR